jgi:hypothetical protein
MKLFLYLLPITYSLFPLPALAALLTLTPTHRSNALGNPIYSLSAYRDGVRQFRLDAVTGTNKSQQRDRHKGDNFAPLPDGNYDIAAIEPGFDREVGKTFVRLTPRFKTKRTHLGIHWDVSYNRRNGYDGTAGCVGLTRRKDYNRALGFIRRYKPTRFKVRIA